MAVNAEQLYLQVDASIELLRKSMKEADDAVGGFDKQVDRYLDQIEKRFAGFSAANLSNSIKKVKEDFASNFNEIQKIAAQTVKSPTVAGGGINLDVGAAKSAAEAARQQAVVTRQIAEAAERAVLSQGALTRENEIWIKSARSAAAAAELEANQLAQQAGRLERLQIELTAAGVKAEHFGQQQQRVTSATGAMKAGTQQLAYNISDVATSFAGGINPMIIFAQQGSQVVQALSLMQQESKGFIAFLGGPWGAAIMGAVTVIGVLATKYAESGSAANLAKAGATGLSDAQSSLGQIFDSVSGKIKNQNELLLLNARLMQLNLAREADAAAKSSRDVFSRAGQAGTFTFGPARITGPAQRRLVEAVQSGKISTDAALRQADALPDSGLSVSREELKKAILDAVEAREKKRVSDLIGKSLDSKVLAPGLRDSDKAQRAADAAARRAEAARQRGLSDDISYTKQERDLRAQLIQATARRASSETEKAKLAIEQVNADADALNTTIDLNTAKGNISAAEAEHLKSLNEQVRRQKLINIEADNAHRILAEKNTIAEHSLEHQIALLTIEGDLAKTGAERKKIAREILDREQELARRKLQAIIDDPTATDSQKSLARADQKALEKRQAKERDRLDQQGGSPLEEYLRQNKKTAGEINEDFQKIGVEGLKTLNDGIADAIVSGRSMGDVFSAVSRQIIADLIKIAVQQIIVNNLMKAFSSVFGGGGAVPGISAGSSGKTGLKAHADGGLLTGPGGPRTDNLLAWLSPGEFIINADSTRRFLPLIKAINDNRLPHHANGGMVGDLRVPTMSRAALRAPAMAYAQPVRVEVVPSLYFDATVDGRAANVAAPMAAQSALASSQMTETRMQRRARRRIG